MYEPKTSPVPKSGLTVQAEQLCELLAKIHARLYHLVDQISGPVPEEANRQAEPSANTIQRRIEIAHYLAQDIDRAIDRLEHGL